MRQRTTLQSSPSKDQLLTKAQLTQRRGGRDVSEPSSTWEITSEQAERVGVGVVSASSSTTTSRDHTPVRPQHQHQPQQDYYQNGLSTNTVQDFASSNNHQRNNKQDVKQRLFQRTRLEDYHTVFRNPHHVPDHQYKEFLQGDVTRRRRGRQREYIGNQKRHSTTTAPIATITKDCCARGCSFFSLIAALFLGMIGLLLDKQAIYIKGTLPVQMVQSQTTGKYVLTYLLVNNGQRLPIATTAYRAALAYLVTVLCCVYILNQTRIHAQWNRLIRRQYRHDGRYYEEIPDTQSTTGADVGGNHFLPTHIHSSAHTSPFRKKNGRSHNDDDVDDDDDMLLSGTPTRAYEQQNNQGILSQISFSVKQWLAVRGYYKPAARFRRKRDPKMV